MQFLINTSESDLKLFVDTLELLKFPESNKIFEQFKLYQKYDQWKYFHDDQEQLHVKQGDVKEFEFVKFRTGLIAIVYDGSLYTVGHDYSMTINYENRDHIDWFYREMEKREIVNIVPVIKITIPEQEYYYNVILKTLKDLNKF